MSRSQLSARMNDLRAAVSECVIGMHNEIELLIYAMLADRHVLMEGVPGVGKTHLANTMASVMGCSLKRVQFTPDLLPSDILGSFVYNPKDGSFNLRRGPIFANLILADEINRAPAKTQSALLEVMQERQVTIEGETNAVPLPFFVFATQNPLEHEGVYPLPQAQLDRFAMRLLPGYLDEKDEVRLFAAHARSLPSPRQVLDAASIIAGQELVATVHVAHEIHQVISAVCRATREHQSVALGASPRLGLDLMHLARARAFMHDRDHVLPDDLKHLMHAVANHRILLTPQAEIGGLRVENVIDEALQSTQLV